MARVPCGILPLLLFTQSKASLSTLPGEFCLSAQRTTCNMQTVSASVARAMNSDISVYQQQVYNTMHQTICMQM